MENILFFSLINVNLHKCGHLAILAKRWLSCVDGPATGLFFFDINLNFNLKFINFIFFVLLLSVELKTPSKLVALIAIGAYLENVATPRDGTKSSLRQPLNDA